MVGWSKDWRKDKSDTPPPPVTSERLQGVFTAKYGVYNQPLPIAGQTIREVFKTLETAWNMPPDIVAYKGRDQLDPDYVIQPTDIIEFHRKMPRKSRAPTVTLVYGVYQEHIPQGDSINGIRLSKKATWNIADDAHAYINDKLVDSAHTPHAGDVVEFVRVLGTPSPTLNRSTPPVGLSQRTERTPRRERLRAWNGNENEAELSIGNIYTTRAFRIANEVELRSVTNAGNYYFLYKPGVNEAVCKWECGQQDDKPLPGVECNCGFYSRKLHCQDYAGHQSGEQVQAITRVSGRVIEGEKGYRSSKIEILGLISNPYLPLYTWKAITEFYKIKLIPHIDFQDPQDLEAILDLVSWNPKGE